jgi:uncharacterized protein YkwD
MFLLALLLWLLSAGAPAHAAVTAERVAAQVLAGVNAARMERGLPPLQADAALAALARDHSQRMAKGGFLSHDEPGGRTFAERIQAAQLSFRRIAENVAMNSGMSDPAAAAVRGWLNSPGHRANILTADFSHTGVGVWVQNDRYYVTQIFLTPQQ